MQTTKETPISHPIDPDPTNRSQSHAHNPRIDQPHRDDPRIDPIGDRSHGSVSPVSIDPCPTQSIPLLGSIDFGLRIDLDPGIDNRSRDRSQCALCLPVSYSCAECLSILNNSGDKLPSSPEREALCFSIYTHLLRNLIRIFLLYEASTSCTYTRALPTPLLLLLRCAVYARAPHNNLNSKHLQQMLRDNPRCPYYHLVYHSHCCSSSSSSSSSKGSSKSSNEVQIARLIKQTLKRSTPDAATRTTNTK